VAEASDVRIATEWLVEGSEGARFARSWSPRGPARAELLLVHGYAEHSGRYDRFGRRLADAGIRVLAPDLGGHGRSSGERAKVDRLEDLVADARRALDRLSAGQGRRPFVLGHSMGGLVATALALVEQERIAGLVLSGAAVSDPSLLETVLPLDPFPEIILDSAHLSRDPRVAADYDTDPLNYRGPMRRETIASLTAGARGVRAGWQELRLPLFVLHGGDDALVPSSGSAELVSAARSGDKQLDVLQGLKHEILNEPEGPEITGRVIDWIRSRVEAGNPLC
jgi:alpha-beta hydrolase superfamily lysophospholipase